MKTVLDFKFPSIKGSAREKGLALLIVLLLLGTTTVLGIGAMSQAITEVRIAGNENCSTRVLNITDAGMEDGILQISKIDQMITAEARDNSMIRVNQLNLNYPNNPLTYWNVTNCGYYGANPALENQPTDTAASCDITTLESGSTTPDGELAALGSTGGQLKYYYEIRHLPRETKKEMVPGEMFGMTYGNLFVVHSLGTGCSTTNDQESRMRRLFRTVGMQEYGH